MSAESVSISTLIQKNTHSTGAQPYNWVGVLEFLHDQHKHLQFKECEWALEKSQMQSKINELEGVIKGLERSVSDLSKRCKMLEIALRQVRQQGGGGEYLNQILRENENLSNLQPVPKRRAKPYKPLLQKIIQEVGIQMIFSPPGSPKNEHSNRPSVMLTPNQNVSQVIQNSGRQSPTNMNSTSGFPSMHHTRSKSQNMTEDQQREPLQFFVSLKHHLDGVRDVFFFQNYPILASASEDCQLKLWDISRNGPDPYLTLRGHTGPLFTVTGVDSRLRGVQNLILTAGSEGVIKSWTFPMPDDFDAESPQSELHESRNSWQAHQDAIWQLCVNAQQNLLLSSGADGVTKLWPLNDGQGEPKLLYQFGQKNQYGHFVDSPTSICWMISNPQQFASAFYNSPIVNCYDVETGRVVLNMKFANDNSASINQITPYTSQNQLLAAHDDGRARILDLNQSKIVQTINAGGDPVTSAIVNTNGTHIYMAVGCSLKVWDIRKQQIVQDLQGMHLPKYDEGIHKLAQSNNMAASMGADGQIRLYTQKLT